MAIIPILFTLPNSNYKKYHFTDCYDEEKNALNYRGQAAIIAHPPCRLWGRLRHMSKAPQVERILAIWAIIQIRKVGGILEHPAGSRLFRKMKIPLDGSPDQYGGFVISINQHWFGFQAKKRTYLYIVGCTRSQIPQLPLNFSAITHSVSSSKNYLELDKSKNSVTAPKLCEWLFEIQRIIEQNKSRAHETVL